MNLSFTIFEIGLVAITLVAVLVIVRSRAPLPPRTEPAPSRVSLLCAVAFFFALLAATTDVAALLIAEAVAYPDLSGLYPREVLSGRKVAEAFRLGALVPAFAALAFAIAGRGAVRESGGALRGRALYRAAALMSLSVIALAWAGVSAAGFTVARLGAP